MNLVQNLYQKDELESKPTRDGFGEALKTVAEKNENIAGLCADLTESTRMHHFAEAFPDRFVQIGVAEQNLIGTAAGLALVGKIPFAASYAVFSPGRSWDQIRVSVCYSQNNVKIVGAHAGLSVGPDGATHQALEDIAITRVLPNMTVVVPADYEQAKRATEAIAEHVGPTYIRLSRSALPIFTTPESPFELGKAQILREGTDVTIVACGAMVYEALIAAEELSKENITAEVINLHTIKPIDAVTLKKSVSKTGKLVTAEEHQINGGMGSAVIEAVADEPVPTQMVGVNDTFGESGTPEELFEKYGLTKDNIINKVKLLTQ